jgi:hypothetical protein
MTRNNEATATENRITLLIIRCVKVAPIIVIALEIHQHLATGPVGDIDWIAIRTDIKVSVQSRRGESLGRNSETNAL